MAKAAAVGPSAVVLVNGPPVAAANTRASVQALTARLERVPHVAGAVGAYTSADPMLRAPNGHASLVAVSGRKNAAMIALMMAVDAMRSPVLVIAVHNWSICPHRFAPSSRFTHALIRQGVIYA